MKRILLAIFVIMLSCLVYGQDKPQLQLHSFRIVKSAGGMANLGTLFQNGWPKDSNGEEDCAWVRVRFENMTMADAANVKFSFGNSAPIEDIKDKLKEAEHEIWLFVTPTENAYMEAGLDKYGMSTRLSNIKLEPKQAYDVVLRNDKTMSINIITKPEGAIASLETGQKENTPATITGVSLGKHTLTISHNGKTLKKEEIEVTEENVRFEYDLRERKMVEFISDSTGAVLFINGEEKGKTPLTIELPYDSYNVEARLSLQETDSKAFTVSGLSETKIKLEPIKKKTFEAFATYNGKKVDADLYIDGKQEGTRQASYTLTKPIGKSYDMNMIYYGNSKKRKIRITKDMDVEQEFKISARNSFVWPWQREYDVCPVGFSMGYVSKQLVTRGEGEKLKENGVWDDGEGKSLHGMQLGLHFQPCFSFGLGLYSGVFYELYMSWNDDYDYNQFMEHCIYVPLHAYYRLPFANKVALSVHGGLGFNYSVYGAYTDDEDNLEDFTDFYGEEAFPKRFNMAAEIGLGFRVGLVQINAQYAKGITNHKSYESLGDYKTKQNKLSLSVSYVFGSN